MNNTQILITLAAAMIATIITRFLPFFLSKQLSQSKTLSLLSDLLPYGSIALLVVYSLKDTSLFNAPYGLFEAIGILVVVLLQVIKSNALLSIAIGTIVYISLVSL